MAPALTLLLIGCLLQGALCGQFNVVVPETIEALTGSCVTIPCSFDVHDDHKSNLDHTCEAIWKKDENTVVFNSINPQQGTIKGKLSGNLTQKDCTTTLNNMEPDHSNKYYFRVKCNNDLKYNFNTKKVDISVKGDPPRPTLTPSTLWMREGTSVNLTCSAPAPCPSSPPALNWTPSLGNSQETLQQYQDKTQVKTSVLTFTASHVHHRQGISCTALYKKQDGSNESATSGSLKLNISFAPRILSSSDCTKAAAQLKCSCETVGNPPPTLQWYLDGLPVNHSDEFAISTEPLNGTGLRITITVNQLRGKSLSTLLCRSSNSVGSTTQRLYVYSLEPQASTESHDLLVATVFITTVAALLILVCAQLLVIRALKRHYKPPEGTVAMSQILSEEGNEVLNTTVEAIYANANVQRLTNVAHPARQPNSGPNHAEGDSKSSEKKNEKGSDIIYSSVNWKRKGGDSVDIDQPGSSSVEVEGCVVGGMCRNIGSNEAEEGGLYDEVEPRNVNKNLECEYAQVKFKKKNVEHK